MRLTLLHSTTASLFFIATLTVSAQQNNQPTQSPSNSNGGQPPNVTPAINNTVAANGTLAGNGTAAVNGTQPVNVTTTTPTTLPTAAALSTGALAGTVAAIAPGAPGVAAGPDDNFIAAAARNAVAGSAVLIALGVGGWLII